MILTTDFWESVINDKRIDHFPDWERIDRSITRLDEKVHTLVSLDDERGSNLFVGGGPSGIVVALSSGQDHFIARQGDETAMVSVVVGGHPGVIHEDRVGCRIVAEPVFDTNVEQALT